MHPILTVSFGQLTSPSNPYKVLVPRQVHMCILFYPTQMFDVPHSKHFMFLRLLIFRFLTVKMLWNQYGHNMVNYVINDQ